jgi:integrase
MARQTERLQGRNLAKLPPGMHPDGRGLYLRVSPAETRSWIYRYSKDGQEHAMGLGALEDIGLAEARERGREARKKLKSEGIDPIKERQAKRRAERLEAVKSVTFRQCAAEWIAAHQFGWSEKHRQDVPSSLRVHADPVIGDLPVAMIDMEDVMRVIGPKWETKTVTMTRVRSRIEAVIGYAITKGYRPSGDNPARWDNFLENLLPKPGKIAKVEHHAALPYAEIPAFMTELRRQEGIAARALEFAVLTAGRAGEVVGSRWSEISAKDLLWTIPADRMKAGKEHRVPLSDAALSIIKEMGRIRDGEFVFPGAKSGSVTVRALLAVLQRMDGREGLTVHGFRSSFVDWCVEKTKFPGELREMALAHAVGSAVERAYRRSDMFEQRWALADAWGAFCAGEEATGGDVIQFPDRRGVA